MFQFDLKLSNEEIDEKLIGEIMFDGLTKYKFNKMKETLLNGKFEFFIERVSSPLSLIVLPNGNLVCGTECTVKLLNEELKVKLIFQF